MNRSWVRFPQAAQKRPPGSGWAFLCALTGRAAWCARGRRPARSWCCVLLLVAPLVLRVPSGLAVGPGCLVCPWAAARPLAVRAASFARRVDSLSGQAPPPPTGAAAWPCGVLRHPPHEWGSLTCGLERRLEARFWLPNSYSARNSRLAVSNFEFVSLELQRFREVLNNDRDKLRAKFVWRWPCRPTEARTAAWPSGSSGAFRTSGAWSAVVASPDSASRAVQNSPCLGSWW